MSKGQHVRILNNQLQKMTNAGKMQKKKTKAEGGDLEDICSLSPFLVLKMLAIVFPQQCPPQLNNRPPSGIRKGRGNLQYLNFQMSFFLNRYRSSNGSDIELSDLEAGGASTTNTSVNNSTYSTALTDLPFIPPNDSEHQMEPTSREDSGRSAIATRHHGSSTASNNPVFSVARFNFDGDDPMSLTSSPGHLLQPVEVYSRQRSSKTSRIDGVEREMTGKVRIVEQSGLVPVSVICD